MLSFGPVMIVMDSRILRLALAAFVLLACATAQRRAQPGPWSKSKIPEGWVVHKTKNYEIQSQAGKEKAKRLGAHMEAMNLVYRNLFRPDKGGSKKQVIKLLKDRKAYHRYGGPGGSAAYYARSHREMVCYDTGKWSDEENGAAITGTGANAAIAKRIARIKDITKMDILGCAAHEGWHQYFSWLVVSVVELPSWLNEGMGDYFYSAKPHAKPTRRNPASLGNNNNGRLMVLKSAIRQGRYVPIPELLRYSKAQYYANPSICYAEGWALCQFLLHSGNKRYMKVIPNFIKLVKNDTNMDVVTEKAFKGIDLEKLDKEFLAYVATLKLPTDEEKKDEKKEDGEGGKDVGGDAKGGDTKGSGTKGSGSKGSGSETGHARR